MEPKQKRVNYSRPVNTAVAVALCMSLGGCYGFHEGKAEANLKKAREWRWEDTTRK